MTERQSTWRPAEIVRELAGLVPTTITIGPTISWRGSTRPPRRRRGADARHLPARPHGVRLRRDGRPVTESVLDRAFTTAEILNQEQAILDWATARLAPGWPRPVGCSSTGRKVELSGGQAQTAAAVAGDRSLVVVVGPAGTGKTTALQPAVAQLHAEAGPCSGVTSSAVAADVLAVETGVTADTIDKLLHEHHKPQGPSRGLCAAGRGDGDRRRGRHDLDPEARRARRAG